MHGFYNACPREWYIEQVYKLDEATSQWNAVWATGTCKDNDRNHLQAQVVALQVGSQF